MATYVNNLRLTEIATGDESGTWGTTTNSNWDFVTDAFGYGVKNMASDANVTYTMADGTVDTLRSMYLKITSGVSLTATRTITIAPNTVSKVWIIENATTGAQSIVISQGSGATVTITTGAVVMLYTDGAGAGAAVVLASPTISTLAGTLPVANGGSGQTSYTDGQLLIGNTTGNTLTKASLTAGSGISITPGAGSITIANTGGGGTVTSVGGTGTVNGITLTGTVTSSGSLTLGGTLSGVSLTTQVTGTLPVANGGTGITSLGTGVATWLGTPSSANLRAAVTDETGSGALMFGTAPTMSGPTINDGYTEEVFAVTGTTPALSPTNGSIQTWTLTASSTPTAGTWAAGQSVTLMIDDGTAYTITWTSVAVTWKTDGGVAPTLNTSGFTAIQLWKVGTTIYGARVGDA